MLSWQSMAVVAIVLAMALVTNPDEGHFVEFAREYTGEALGLLPGVCLALLY